MNTSTFEHRGRTFTMAIEHDAGLGEPWKEHDGHGIVSEWTTRSPEEGEREAEREHDPADQHECRLRLRCEPAQAGERECEQRDRRQGQHLRQWRRRFPGRQNAAAARQAGFFTTVTFLQAS